LKTLVASLGFDVDFIMRRISAERFDRIVCVALKTDEDSWKRVEKAYNLIKYFAKTLNIDVVLEPVKPSHIVNQVYRILYKVVDESEATEVYGTGGPRIIVVALLIASLLLPRNVRHRVKFLVEGEAFEASLTFNPADLVDYLTLAPEAQSIISYLLSVDAPVRAMDVVRGTGLPKSTVYKYVKRLIERGFIEEDEHKRIRLSPRISGVVK